MPQDEKITALSFEVALDELESIVGRLENGDTPLEESIALYHRGNQLKRHCEKTLKEAEERVEKITLDAHASPTGVEKIA